MNPNKEATAVRLGLLVFPPQGQVFPGRRGQPDSNFLVDSRGAGAKPMLRNEIVAALLDCLTQFDDVQVIAGLAKSGMTWAAWVAQQLGLPYATILLDGPRSAGLKREIEGNIHGLRTVLVDNWVSSGASLIQASEVVARHGGQVLGALAVAGQSPELGFPVQFAYRVEALLQAAEEQGLTPISSDNIHH